MKPLTGVEEPSSLSDFDVAVLLSGGLDSAVLLKYLSEMYSRRLVALHFLTTTNSPELRAARLIAAGIGVPLWEVDIHSFLDACQYQREPHRLVFGSTVLFAMGITFAVEHSIAALALGLHRDDGHLNHETTPEYLRLLATCIDQAQASCSLLLPFHTWDKVDVIREGARLGVRFEDTWSCNSLVGNRHDGVCESCRERHEAFATCQIADPVEYLNL